MTYRVEARSFCGGWATIAAGDNLASIWRQFTRFRNGDFGVSFRLIGPDGAI
jgi:hypothetical protein